MSPKHDQTWICAGRPGHLEKVPLCSSLLCITTCSECTYLRDELKGQSVFTVPHLIKTKNDQPLLLRQRISWWPMASLEPWTWANKLTEWVWVSSVPHASPQRLFFGTSQRNGRSLELTSSYFSAFPSMTWTSHVWKKPSLASILVKNDGTEWSEWDMFVRFVLSSFNIMF